MLLQKFAVLAFIFISAFSKLQACNNESFIDVCVQTSEWITTEDNPTDNYCEEKFTGCISAQHEYFDKALEIKIIYQKVSVLETGAVRDLRNLSWLKLHHNEIEQIRPEAFTNLSRLSRLDLSYNKLEAIHRDVFNNLTVEWLNLDHNKIFSIESEAFDDMPKLIRLVLDDNLLSEWSASWFTGTPNVNFVSVAHNQIAELKCEAFKKLTIFSNSGDHDDILPCLILSGNHISKIDTGAFEGLERAYILDLADNKIETIEDKTFANFRKIDRLLLSNNQIGCLSDRVMARLPQCDFMDLNGNIIDCDCFNQIESWAKGRRTVVEMNFTANQCDLKTRTS